MARKLRVGVICGGRSTEHEVSLVSAGSVIDALDKNKYEVIPIGITHTGEWLAGANTVNLLKKNKGDEEFKVYLPPDPTVKFLLKKENAALSASEINQAGKLDVIFPVLHGTYGEDGTIQGLLELANIPYVGAGVLGSSLSMDKILQKQVCRQSGVPVVDFLWFRSIDWQKNKADGDIEPLQNQLMNKTRDEMVAAVIHKLGLPVFVKPPNMGSSVGISKAHDKKELVKAIHVALEYDRKVLIEKAVPNAREIEVSVLGNEEPRASVAGEVIPCNEFYDYDAKYVDDASELNIPANIPENISSAIRQTAINGVLAVEAEGMARVDFLLEKNTNNFYLNEINTIPGFTKISMYPKLWQASGLSYSELLDELIRLAIDRHEKRTGLNTTFQPKKEWYK